MSDTDDADSRRNTYVEAAVTATLERIDAFAAGAELRPITAQLRAACDSLLDEQSASARGTPAARDASAIASTAAWSGTRESSSVSARTRARITAPPTRP